MAEVALSKDALLAIARFGSIENKIHLLHSNECPQEAVPLIINGAYTSRPLSLLPLMHLPPEYLDPGDWILVGHSLTPSNLVDLYTILEHIENKPRLLRFEDIGINEAHILPRYLAQTLAVAQFSDFDDFYNFINNTQLFHCSNKVRSVLRLAIGVGLALNPYVSMEFLFKLRPKGNYFKLAVDLNPQMGTDIKRLRRLFKLLTMDETTAAFPSYAMKLRYHPVLPYLIMLKRLFNHPNLPLELLIQTTMSKNKEMADLAKEALENNQEGRY